VLKLTKAHEQQFQTLTRRVRRDRFMLEDQDSPVGSIKRPRGHSRAVFQQRIHALAIVENQRANLLREITTR